MVTVLLEYIDLVISVAANLGEDGCLWPFYMVTLTLCISSWYILLEFNSIMLAYVLLSYN